MHTSSNFHCSRFYKLLGFLNGVFILLYGWRPSFGNFTWCQFRNISRINPPKSVVTAFLMTSPWRCPVHVRSLLVFVHRVWNSLFLITFRTKIVQWLFWPFITACTQCVSKQFHVLVITQSAMTSFDLQHYLIFVNCDRLSASRAKSNSSFSLTDLCNTW